MEKLKLNIPIYASVVSMAKYGLNVNDAIMDQLNQGDPTMEEIVEKLVDTYGENDLIDTEDFSPFIEGDSESITIDANEMASIGNDYETVALDVDFTFDIEAFGKEHNLEPIRNKILDYINKNQKGFDLEGVEIAEEDVDDIQRKIKEDSMELEKACDEVLQGIRDCLDEGLEDNDIEME